MLTLSKPTFMGSLEVPRSVVFSSFADSGSAALAQLVTSSPAPGHLAVHLRLLSAEDPSEWPYQTESKKPLVHPLVDQTRKAGSFQLHNDFPLLLPSE